MQETATFRPVDAALATSPAEPFTTTAIELREPGPHELLVKVVAAGICHTDLMTKGKGLCEFPIVLGHEGAGIVEQVGSQVTEFSVGDHVLMTYDFCGSCPSCDANLPSYCVDHGSLNFGGVRPDGERTHRSPDATDPDIVGSFFQQSSLATYALSHQSNTVAVDSSLPLATLAPLACGVQTGAGTVLNTLKVDAGTSLAVFGCGCVGLSAVMAAKVASARQIVAIDINPQRLELAMELGATHTINPSDVTPGGTVDDALSALCPAGFNYAIDTTGIPTVLRQAFDSCGPRGVTAMIAPGVPGTEVTVEMMGLLPGKSLRGVIQGDSVSKTFIPKLIDLWQGGHFPFDRLITMFESLDAVEEAAAAMETGAVIKPVVIISDQQEGS